MSLELFKNCARFFTSRDVLRHCFGFSAILLLLCVHSTSVNGYPESIKMSKPCMPRNFGTVRNPAIVCVCDLEYCDNLQPIRPTLLGTYQKYVTSKSGHRFFRSDDMFSQLQRTPFHFINYILPAIYIEPYTQYQTIYGWGGHFTDSAGIDITSLPFAVRNSLMRSLFSDEGNEFSMCRVPMGGNVMSTRVYSYDDYTTDDPNLEHFLLQNEDLIFKIPLIKEALSLTGGKLKLIGYPSSPPLWMKSTQSWTDRAVLRDEYHQTYADYYVKYLNAYENNGIKFWAVTSGDAPSLSGIRFFPINSLGWNTTMHVKWIGENLGPTLKNSQYNYVKLLIFDDMRNHISSNLPKYLRNRKCLKYADGVAVQSYGNTIAPPSTLLLAQTPYKDLFLLSTSAANGLLGYYGAENFVELGSWRRAANYIEDILANLEFNTVGWLDFNLASNMAGGHTWNGMGFDAPIVVNKGTKEFYKQPMFYAFGHFSKFLPPGTVRLKTSTDWTYTLSGLHTFAFLRPDNGFVIIVYNRGYMNRQVHITVPNRGLITLDTETNSITNIVYW